ncbi:MAG: O-antigen ligase family protein [bacterium]|nr:O-antigen ligase family protein [bacterium]
MKLFKRLLVLAIITSLSLGQLTRITINPTAAFYFHDILIMIFLIFSWPNFQKNFSFAKIKKIIAQKYQNRPVLTVSLIFIFLLSLSQTFFSLTASLYLCRFIVYVLFIFVVWQEKIFSRHEWRQLIQMFFFVLAIFGLLQYFFLPDPSFLENLGWDDHRYRLIGTWFDPAFTALAYVFGLIYLIWQQKNINSKIFFYLNFVCLSLALLLTYSRSAFLALGLITLIYFLRTFKNKKFAFSKKFLFITISSLLIIGSFIFIVLAIKYPSDSTNLLRTNSIESRLKMLQLQWQNFSYKTWLIGDGFFVARFPQTELESLNMAAKKTMPFPDNFFLLLISFFGLPLTTFFCYSIYKQLKKWWFEKSVLFYLALELLIVAQFNQTVFQPFIILTFGLLLIAIKQDSAV